MKKAFAAFVGIVLVLAVAARPQAAGSGKSSPEKPSLLTGVI